MAFFKGCIVLNNGKVVRCNYTKIMDVPKDLKYAFLLTGDQ